MPTPFFFEAKNGKRLFAIADSPAGEQSSATGVIFCHAFAEERQKTYRATYHFTQMLRERGIPSFRFDYLGTGDSDGSLLDVTLDRMLADTLEIAEHARASLACDSLIFLGIRLGALIAGRAVSALPWADTCVMWNPVIKGGDYYRALKRTQKLIRLSRLRDSPPLIVPPDSPKLEVIEADLMTAEMVTQIKSLDLLEERFSISELLVTARRDEDKERANVKEFAEKRASNGCRVDVWLDQPREYWSTRSMYDAYFPVPTFEETLMWIQSKAETHDHG